MLQTACKVIVISQNEIKFRQILKTIFIFDFNESNLFGGQTTNHLTIEII